MELTIVGTRSAVPSPGDPSSGYLVTAGQTTVLLDCGPGVAGAIETVVPATRLDAVLISHMHSDHCYDLLPLGKALVHGRRAGGNADRVMLVAPDGAIGTLRRLNQLFPVGGSDPALDSVFDEVFDVIEHGGTWSGASGGCSIALEPVRHAVPGSAIRLEAGGASLVYSGDTGWTENLVRLASGAGLLLCEATLRVPDTSGHGHLSAREAGRAAAAAEVGHLVLTHFVRTDPSWLAGLVADAAAEYTGPISVARPGMRIPVPATRHPNPTTDRTAAEEEDQ